MTGTQAGVGTSTQPIETIGQGDEFTVEIPSYVDQFVYEK